VTTNILNVATGTIFYIMIKSWFYNFEYLKATFKVKKEPSEKSKIVELNNLSISGITFPRRNVHLIKF